MLTWITALVDNKGLSDDPKMSGSNNCLYKGLPGLSTVKTGQEPCKPCSRAKPERTFRI